MPAAFKPMNTIRISRHLIIVVIVLAAAIFIWTAVHALFYAPDTAIDLPAAALTTAISTSSEPTRLQIPALHIDANVQYLGINAAGNMQAPDNFVDVGWYKYGIVPGYPGSAVIDGHVDNGLALAGVFKHLDEINVGDDVYIVTRGGSKLHFVVTRTALYSYANAPTALIFAYSDVPHLNLITCAGTWIAGKDTYDQRLVVFTQLAAS